MTPPRDAVSRRAAVATAEVDWGELGDGALAALVAEGMAEQLRRAVERGDPDTLVREALQSMFSGSGDPAAPQLVTANLVALAGSIQETGADRHSCKLYTVRLPDGGAETWAWEDSPTFVHGDSDKVGKVRRSVNLHTAVEGMIVIRHSMTKRGGGELGHVRNSTTAHEVQLTADEHGEVTGARLVPLPDWTPSHLPPPAGEEDSRSAAGRGR